jgi:hypothetical protein
MENKEEKDKELLDKLMKEYEQEQMRLHPEIYDKKLNNEIDK